MPQTHLPAHLDSVRSKCRPKHQLLVLKCYPRLPKNSAADVKPNSSELSYLLYYASTRRVKLHKLGAFLEKKTAADVWRWQSARVLVTLQILTAFIEHNIIGKPKGFALIAPSVLRIIREIITNTNDISLIEATLPTWDALCQHQSPTTLAADSEYRALYEEVVGLYGTLAKNNAKKLARSTQPVAAHDAIRLRRTGLSGVECVFGPPELANGWRVREFEAIIPAIMSNLRNDDPGYITHIEALRTKSEEEEKLKASNRRHSMAHTRTLSGLPEVGQYGVPVKRISDIGLQQADPDPRAAEGTAQEADRLEEEEIAMLALDCLKAIFQSQNRGQVRNATIAFLRSVSGDAKQQHASATIIPWATRLFHLFTSWTPFQERFLLLVSAVDSLVATPLESQNVRAHLLFTNLIDDILCSDLNVIGLSILDVLLSLLKQTLRTARLTDLHTTQHDLLMQRLKDCTADLATHVYYSDQISDMIAAILLRVKAAPAAEADDKEVPLAPATTEGATSAHDLASTLSRSPTREKADSIKAGFFNSNEERQLALEIINDILKIASTSQQYSAVSVVTTRSPVPVDVWEGTEWLLHDPSPGVQKAYKDALTSWAQFESSQKDAKMIDFDDAACVTKLIQEARPLSLKGSLGPSILSHRQLLLAPAFNGGGERRLSTPAKTESNGDTDSRKPKVTFQYLKDVVDGKYEASVKLKARKSKPMTTDELLKLVDQTSLNSPARLPTAWRMAEPPH